MDYIGRCSDLSTKSNCYIIPLFWFHSHISYSCLPASCYHQKKKSNKKESKFIWIQNSKRDQLASLEWLWNKLNENNCVTIKTFDWVHPFNSQSGFDTSFDKLAFSHVYTLLLLTNRNRNLFTFIKRSIRFNRPHNVTQLLFIILNFIQHNKGHHVLSNRCGESKFAHNQSLLILTSAVCQISITHPTNNVHRSLMIPIATD